MSYIVWYVSGGELCRRDCANDAELAVRCLVSYAEAAYVKPAYRAWMEWSRKPVFAGRYVVDDTGKARDW